jgi:hypothetical protein
MTEPRTNAQRQAAYKSRREAMGLKRVPSLWAHPEDVPAIRAYVAKLNKRRERIKLADAIAAAMAPTGEKP